MRIQNKKVHIKHASNSLCSFPLRYLRISDRFVGLILHLFRCFRSDRAVTSLRCRCNLQCAVCFLWAVKKCCHNDNMHFDFYMATGSLDSARTSKSSDQLHFNNNTAACTFLVYLHFSLTPCRRGLCLVGVCSSACDKKLLMSMQFLVATQLTQLKLSLFILHKVYFLPRKNGLSTDFMVFLRSSSLSRLFITFKCIKKSVFFWWFSSKTIGILKRNFISVENLSR